MTGQLPVSILIPLYNGVELLAECVQSLRGQSYTHWEALIGVNGHPEGSVALEGARALVDERVRVLHYPDIRSAPQTLNRLARAASHPWVCLLDADDVWHPHKLEQQLPALSLGVDVVGTFCEYFGDRGGRPRLPSGNVPRSAFFRANPMIHSSILMRREDVRFRDEFLYDYDLWLRLDASGRRFFNVPATLTMHRVHGGSMFNSQANAEERKRELLLRHAGSERNLWWSQKPWPFGRTPAQRPRLDSP